MALAAGTHLGSYEVVAQIGAGGMGEVYKAHDTKLGRDVAIKVLPETFADDSERLARFQREAKMLAALNDPNIATIHGLEHSDGTHYLVMELVAGETLAERVNRDGAMPVEEALKVAVQIAEALEAAHEKGIIHRDLKPANVKVTPEGKVKVLDFGLAKAFTGDGAGEDPSNSPTLSMAATMHGVILGTAAYMSPEQARGKSVDKRTDIWAFGCVLYEILTGKQAFQGEDITDILASVVRAEPDWNRLPDKTATSIRTLLQRCLQKDKTLRLQAAGDARIEIHEALAAPTAEPRVAAIAQRAASWQRATVLGLAAVVIAALATLVNWNLRPTPASPARSVVARFTVALRLNEGLDMSYGGLAFSPDGAYIAYTSRSSGGTRQLFLRPLDRSEAVAIPGSEGATGPFFSADGQWIAFTADGKLKKAPLAGGTPIALCDKSTAGTGSWSSDGTIFFPETGDKLMRVQAAGGAPQVVATAPIESGEESARWPEALPGGQAILYVSGGTEAAFSDDSNIIVQSLKTGARKTLVQGGTSPHYLSTGHLVYAQGGRVLAAPFDLRRLEVTGAATPILEDVWQGTGGYAAYGISRDGSIAYVNGGRGANRELRATLEWVDRAGVSRALGDASHAFQYPSLSPDGQRVAIWNGENGIYDIWIADALRGSLTRLTFSNLGDGPVGAIWTPDGKRVIYALTLNAFKLAWRAADGTGAEEELLSGSGRLLPMACSPDGQLLLFYRRQAGHGDLWVLPLVGERKAWPLIESPFDKTAAQISPDGHWLAYASNESMRQEVFVQPFPGLGGKWQISSNGGAEPQWSRNGRQLFYLNGDKMMVADVGTRGGFTASAPRLLFDRPYAHGVIFANERASYDVAPDGQHFLMLKADQSQSSLLELRVVLNWAQEVTRRVSTGK